MSKKYTFHQIAKEAGILNPEVIYERREKAYSIRIIIPNPDRKGFINPAVGVYRDFDAARQQLPDDLLEFIKKYPSAVEKVTKTYDDVTSAEADDPTVLLRDLLEQLATGKLPDDLSGKAKAGLEALEKILAQLPPEEAQGEYTSRHPDKPTAPIEWQQPKSRQHPVYIFEIDCDYCGQTVKLERHSPREPQHCGKVDCRDEHRRRLARERKRRQRARERGTGKESR